MACRETWSSYDGLSRIPTASVQPRVLLCTILWSACTCWTTGARAGAGATANPTLGSGPAEARGGSGTSGDQGLPGFPDPGLPPG